MTDQSSRDAWIINDRHGLRFDLAGTKAANGAFTGIAANVDGLVEVTLMARRGIIIVALHRGALTSEHGNGEGMGCASVAACKAT